MDFRFPKEQHIFLKRDIDALLEEGEVMFKYPLKIYYKHNPGAVSSRALFSVPKRNLKRAVWRNLLKRRMREAFRLNRHKLGELRVDIFFIFIGKEVCEYGKISSRMEDLFGLIVKNAEEGGQLSADCSGEVLPDMHLSV